jgi:hypothetical protein
LQHRAGCRLVLAGGLIFGRVDIKGEILTDRRNVLVGFKRRTAMTVIFAVEDVYAKLLFPQDVFVSVCAATTRSVRQKNSVVSLNRAPTALTSVNLAVFFQRGNQKQGARNTALIFEARKDVILPRPVSFEVFRRCCADFVFHHQFIMSDNLIHIGADL